MWCKKDLLQQPYNRITFFSKIDIKINKEKITMTILSIRECNSRITG